MLFEPDQDTRNKLSEISLQLQDILQRIGAEIPMDEFIVLNEDEQRVGSFQSDSRDPATLILLAKHFCVRNPEGRFGTYHIRTEDGATDLPFSWKDHPSAVADHTVMRERTRQHIEDSCVAKLSAGRLSVSDIKRALIARDEALAELEPSLDSDMDLPY